MINKFYKIINNKYSRFFKFVFFLRYLLAVFFVAIVFFLNIPKFFDYKKKEENIKNYLLKNYDLEIKKLDKIKFNSFPLPSLKINDLVISFHSEDINLNVQKLIIYPNLFSIYNYENFQVRKIKLENSNFISDIKNLQFLTKKLSNLKKKLHFKNLNIKIKDSQSHVIDLNKMNFFNFGYKKNIIDGEVFKRNFKIKFLDKSRVIFKLPDTGISITLNITDSSLVNRYMGNLKGNILKSNFKFNFIFEESFLKIDKFFLRNKDLSFDSKGTIRFNPFFKINLDSEVRNLNLNLLSNLDINNLLKYETLIKRLNSQNNITFSPKKFGRNFIKDLNIQTETAYGRLKISKNFYISDSLVNCKNSINLLEEFPILYFDCTINSKDKKKLLKKFGIDYKIKKESLNIKSTGNINILNNKINFDLVEINENYKASKEDLKFYKKSFEKILFNRNFIEIFDLSKIKNFIKYVS